MAKEAHSAVSSWSGYVYQGKIALYLVLRTIKEKYENNLSFDFSNYSLEVEWQEDFSIKEGKKYLSIHQVKAHQDDMKITDYKKPIKGLLHKIQTLYDFNGYAYLHISTSINYNRKTTSFSSYQKKNFYFKFFPLKYSKKVKLYKYCTDNDSCDLDEADQLILKKIEEIYQLNNFDIESLTLEQYEYIRFKLYQLLDTHILKIHQKQIKKDDPIPFNEVLDFFKNNYEEYSEEYKHIKVKNFVLFMISKYCDDEELCTESECKNDCWLYKIERDLEQLPAKEVYKIVLNATPHYEKFEDLQQEDNLIYGLIKSYHQLDEKRRTQEYLYENKKYFLPSSISGKNDKDIAKRILKNKNLDAIVKQFEIDTIISDDMKIENLEQKAQKLRSVTGEGINKFFENREESAIAKIKNLQVIPLDDIKEEINGAD